MRPYLPEKPANSVLVSMLFPQYMRDALAELDIECINVRPSKNLNTELRFHPDVLMLNVEDGVWYTEKSNEQMFDFGEVRRIEKDLAPEYPNDCLLNDIVFGNNVICGKNDDAGVFCGRSVYRVKQGYAKCSTIILNENAFITSDTGIFKILSELGCDALFVTNDTVKLNGYSCGFIGGCAGKLSKDLLAFTGDIDTHPDAEKIKAFCKKHNVRILSLGYSELYDYGGIIPVSEK